MISRAIGLCVLILAACGKPAARPVQDAAARQALPPSGVGLAIEGVGDLFPGAHPDPSVLEAAGPDPTRRWARQQAARGEHYRRALPLGEGPGAPPLLLREQIWLEHGAVIHVGQGYTVVAGQCGTALRGVHHRLMAALAVACGPGAAVSRYPGTEERMVHYLCERPDGIAKIDLRAEVPAFVDTRTTRAGVLTVSLFAPAAAGAWLAERSSERRRSALAALQAEARPLSDHVAACERSGRP